MRPFHLITTAIVLLGFLAIGAIVPAAAYEEAPPPSGFLDDYSMLKADPAEADTRLIYLNPKFKPSDFNGLDLEELVFYLYASDEGHAISGKEAAKMLELAGLLDDTLREELTKQGANLVDAPAEGILHCRWAITDITKSKSVARIVPAARATGVGRGSAAMEGECRDGGSGEIVWQVIKASKGKRTSGVTTWSGAESAVRQWARDLAERIAAKRQADS